MNHILLKALLPIYILSVIVNTGFAGLLDLGPEEFVQANGLDIQVQGYSVPSYVDWNNDGLNDLVIGQGGGSYSEGKVRVYLNHGTAWAPLFTDYFYAQSNGADLTVPAQGCMGCFPRVVYWDGDNRKDLLVGVSSGYLLIFLNIGSDSQPTFDGGTTLKAGSFGMTIDLGSSGRPTPEFMDWDNDGLMDLVVGARDGKIHVYHNCGCTFPVPAFFFESSGGTIIQENGSDLLVPTVRSSPQVLDVDGDGNKDLLTGNTEGQLLFYKNTGTDNAPVFSGYSLVEANDVPIALPSQSRSRPFVCDWTGDGCLDMLIGAGDGKVHLFQGEPELPKFAAHALSYIGPEKLVKANGFSISVSGYSVPSFVDWNSDGLKDLIIGEGSGTANPAKVRVYLNVGTEMDPNFSGYFYAQSDGSNLELTGSGCLGCFPRVVYWDKDERKDLLIGLSDGTVGVCLNIGTEQAPTFGPLKFVEVGQYGYGLDVGSRATPTLADWNSDGLMDLVAGGLDGKIHLYFNSNVKDAVPPQFRFSDQLGDSARQNGLDLSVPSGRSSPEVFDLNGDGKKDLLTGNTEGELLLYFNTGTDAEPNFSDYLQVDVNGVPINLPGSARSRPFVCDWNGDGYLDVLIGAGDGYVHLYQSVPPTDLDRDGDVDLVDFAILAANWRQRISPTAGNDLTKQSPDINRDGKVDAADLKLLTADWLLGL